MNLVSQLLIVVGFCVASIGAAGFGVPLEDGAMALFIGGMIALAVGAFMAKQAAKAEQTAKAASIADSGITVQSQIEGLRDLVAKLDDEKATLASEVLCQRIDDLLTNEYFDLTSKNDEIARDWGFSNYAKVWDGVATAERLLSRVWSIATDGHLEEALESLPEARRSLERAAEQAAAVPA